MERAVGDLIDAVDPGERASIALVGGGGKTTLMFALAEALRSAGRRVITSTTTKVWHREALRAPAALLCDADSLWRDKMAEGLKGRGHVFVGQSLLPSGKIKGIDPGLADELYREPLVDFVLLEADGSAGRPVKVPAAHEPVVPASATTVIAVMGLEALGKPLGPDLVFRMGRFEGLTGLSAGQTLSPRSLASAFLDPNGLFRGAPGRAGKIAFLNKCDLAPDRGQVAALSDLLLSSPHRLIERVVVGSLTKKEYRVLTG